MRRARYRFALASPALLATLRGAIRATGDRGARLLTARFREMPFLSAPDPASAIACTLTARRLCPSREIGCYCRLCERPRLCSVLSPPFRNRLQLSQNRDGPTIAVCTGHPGVADGATGTALWTDHSLGARAKGQPFHRCLGGSFPAPGAEFTGELPEVIGAVLWHAEGHPPKPGRL